MKTFSEHLLFKRVHWQSGNVPSFNPAGQVSVLLALPSLTLPNKSQRRPKSPKAARAKAKPQLSQRRRPMKSSRPGVGVSFTGDTGASHTRAGTRLPRGPALALTPNCTRSRNVARFNARDSKASGTQWEGRARTSCSVKQAKKKKEPRTTPTDGGVGRRGCRI